MARVTVEDCLEQVDNRFALVLIAAQRTRQIIKGAPTLLDIQAENKEAVLALREIAAGLIPYAIEAPPSQEELEEAVKVLSRAQPEPAETGPTTSQLFAGLLDLDGPYMPRIPADEEEESSDEDSDADSLEESAEEEEEEE